MDTKTSQRHLNGIKSIFGGLKNWWAGEGKKEETPQGPLPKKPSASLQQAMEADRDTGTHPAFRLRSGDVRGFYDEDVVEFNPNDTSGYGGQRMTGSSTSAVKPQAAATGLQKEKQTSHSAEWNEYEENLSKNLGLCFFKLSMANLMCSKPDYVQCTYHYLIRVHDLKNNLIKCC